MVILFFQARFMFVIYLFFMQFILLNVVFDLYSEFQLIHELCLYVLSASQRTELIRATLSTLHAFLSWIPLGYIFESTLVNNSWFLKWLSCQCVVHATFLMKLFLFIIVIICFTSHAVLMCLTAANTPKFFPHAIIS